MLSSSGAGGLVTVHQRVVPSLTLSYPSHFRTVQTGSSYRLQYRASLCLLTCLPVHLYLRLCLRLCLRLHLAARFGEGGLQRAAGRARPK